MPKIGGHVSASGGVENAFLNALKIEAEAFQFFLGPPQMWVKSNKTEAEVQRFREKAVETGITDSFIHGTYLINLGTQSPEHLQKSIDWLIYAMNTAADLQVKGVIFHLGSHKGLGFEAVLPQVVSSLKEILSKSQPTAVIPAKAGIQLTDTVNGSPEALGHAQDAPQSKTYKNPQLPFLLLENTAGAGGNIGATFKQLGEILKQVQDDRLKICLDTQHAFAAGIDIKTKEGVEAAVLEMDEEFGIENLIAIHCNDSKTDFGSGRDRHENIGEGFIGKEAFGFMLNHPKLSHVPFILEVPGFDDKGPDKENIEILHSLLKV